MSFRQKKLRFILLTRKLISYSVIWGIALSLIPLPYLSGPLAYKDCSIPFPCQDHVCTCSSAAHCSASCCCFSHRQKQAWARSHGLASAEEDKTHNRHKALLKKKLLLDANCSTGSARVVVESPEADASAANVTDEFCEWSPNKAPESVPIDPTIQPEASPGDIAISSLPFHCHSGKSYFLGGLPWGILGDPSPRKQPTNDRLPPLTASKGRIIANSPPIPPPRSY